MDRTILHCDLNNFFASVECRNNPELKKCPVAVCGDKELRHGIVLAKNEEAKKFGVKTGEAIWQAQKKCIRLKVISPHYDEYIKYSGMVRKIYERYTDLVEPFGIDECWLDVTGSQFLYGSGQEIAESIRKNVKTETGLTVSVGVSFNKMFAKLGSDLKKPDAVSVITREGFMQEIWNLGTGMLFGVGMATEERLALHGILTIGDIARCSDEFIKKLCGKNGITLKRYALGLDDSPVTVSGYAPIIKSVGHGTTPPEDICNPEDALAFILRLSEQIAGKLKDNHLKASGVSLGVRNNELFTREFQTQLDYPTQSSYIIAQTAYSLFVRNYIWEKDVRTLTVCAINLVTEETPIQTNLLCDYDKYEKCEKTETAIYEIRKKYGESAIRYGTAMLCEIKEPPRSVSFGGAREIC